MGMMVFRLVLSLAFVAFVLWFAARVAKKRGLGRGATLIETLARQPMTRTSSVNVIRVAGRVFVIGSTETQITVIGEVDDEDVTAAMAEQANGTEGGQAGGNTSRPINPSTGPMAGSVFDRSQWSAVVEGMREKTVRRS